MLPVETTLIRKEDIENSDAKNVSEILRNIPGFCIQGENVTGLVTSWRSSRLRGFSFWQRAPGLSVSSIGGEGFGRSDGGIRDKSQTRSTVVGVD